MKKEFISAFILLATLVLANAAPHQLYKRTTSFNACPIDTPASLLSASISPDPFVKGQNVEVKFSGKSPIQIRANNGIKLEIAFLDSGGLSVTAPFVVDFCGISGIKCPLLEYSAMETVSVPNLDNIFMAVSIIDENRNTFIACAWSGPSPPSSVNKNPTNYFLSI